MKLFLYRIEFFVHVCLFVGSLVFFCFRFDDMSTINGDGGRTTSLPKTNGEKFNGTSGEATDDVKATQQHIKNLETELKHAREALSGLCIMLFFF